MAKIIDRRDKINTGDTLFFSGSTTTSFLIKFFTNSNYNHVGIAVRLDKNKRVTTKKSGNLYILEVNAISRYDIISEKLVSGFALTDYDDLISSYNLITLLRLKKKYKTSGFCKRIENFIDEYKNVKYNSTLGPIIGVWIGCPISGLQKDNEMFCTELSVYFYLEIFYTFPTINKPARLYTINDFFNKSDNYIYKHSSYDVFIDYSDYKVSLIVPMILGIFFAVLITMLFPKKKNN